MGDILSEDDLIRAREGYRKFLDDDPSFLDDWDPDAEIHVPPSLPGGGDLRGPFAFVEFLAAMAEHWEDARPQPEEFLLAGDKIVVLGTWHGRSRATGREAHAPFAHVIEARNGRWTYLRNYIDSAAILESLEAPVP